MLNKLSQDQYTRKLLAFNTYIDQLKLLKSYHKRNNISDLPGMHSSYPIDRLLSEATDARDTFIKQQNCNHENTTGLEYVGHDSHKDHFYDKCIDCELILKRDTV